MEPATGLEPATSPLPRKCSTTELRGHKTQVSFTLAYLFSVKQLRKKTTSFY